MADDKEPNLTDAPKDPTDPDAHGEGDPGRQHPADHSFLLQSMNELRGDFGRFGERVDNLKDRVGELREDLRHAMDQLRDDRRSDANRIAGDLRTKLDSRSFWIGIGMIVAVVGLVNLPEIFELASRIFTDPAPIASGLD